VYLPTEPREQASRSALQRVVDTFFAGSFGAAIASLVDEADQKLSADEVDRIEAIIKKAKRK